MVMEEVLSFFVVSTARFLGTWDLGLWLILCTFTRYTGNHEHFWYSAGLLAKVKGPYDPGTPF
jgi:hypothetical protein